MFGGVRLTILAVGVITLSACESLPLIGGEFPSSRSQSFSSGSRLAVNLSPSDMRLLDEAVVDAMEQGAARRWRGARAAGAVTPAGWSLGNLRTDPDARTPVVRSNLDLGAVVETDLGLYVLTRNANVRLGPGTEYGIAEKMASGAGVEIVGRTIRDDWMLVSFEGAVRGYVSARLMIKAPGTELELAGGPRRRATLCREFVQRLSIGSERDEWTGAACQGEDGEWRPAREPQPRVDATPLLLD